MSNNNIKTLPNYIEYLKSMKKKKLMISEQAFIFLFESLDINEIENLKRLVDSGDMDNINLAIEVGKSNGYDVNEYIATEYQPYVNILEKTPYSDDLKNKNYIEKIVWVINNLNSINWGLIDNYKDKINYE
jgi:hypothetical protein